MTRLLWLTLAALLVAGCSSWSGPAEVRLKDGTTIACPKGLRFNENVVICQGTGVTVDWEHVAGYSTR